MKRQNGKNSSGFHTMSIDTGIKKAKLVGGDGKGKWCNFHVILFHNIIFMLSLSQLIKDII